MNIIRKTTINNIIVMISLFMINGCFSINNAHNDLDNIYDDKYYVIKGGIYKDDNVYGCPGKIMRQELIMYIMHQEENCTTI